MERADLEQWKAREVARLLALVETERRYYQEISASIPVGLLVLSQDLAMISANRAIRKIFGLTGSPLRARLDTLLPAWVLDKVGEVLKTGVPQSNILLSESKSGRRLRIGILAIRSWDDDSSPEALLSIEDLTGIDTVAVPVPSKTNGSDLIDNLDAVVWTLEVASSRFQFVSPSAAGMLGYPVQHWTGNATFWTDRVHMADREWVAESYRQAIQSGETHTLEFRAMAADGRTLWVRESARPIPEPSGRPRYWIGVSIDTTEHHLLEDQLLQAERVQSSARLAGRMAHDLNNALMIVTGHSEELLSGLPANSPLRADVQEIVNATERMTSLTGHLLSFTRRQGVAPSAVDVQQVLRAVEQRLGVQFNPSTQPSVVKADADRLEQVVASLIERERPVTIEIAPLEIKEDLRHPGESLRPGWYGVIAITLRGRAFDPESKSNWFEAALPAKDAVDDWPSAVTRAYGIIRQWGGDIAVSAAAEGGTVLRIFLASAAGANEKKLTPVAPAGAKPGPETILVVDDEAGIRELVQKILRRHGYEVMAAADGEEALAIFREHPEAIRLLITDVMMPRMGGPELVDRLRKQGLNPGVIYVSGYTDDPNIYAKKFPPGTTFLEKPFTLSSLLDRVREVLRTPK